MLMEKCDHNRFASQLAERIAAPVNALVVPTSAGAVTTTHNSPPGRLDYAREALDDLRSFLTDNPAIVDHAAAKGGSALKERTLVAMNEARTERESKTSPIRETLNAIYKTYELVKDKGPMETAYNELRKRLTKYAQAIEDARIAEASKLRAEAEEQERLASEAERAEQDAIAGADVGECTDVVAAIDQADKAFTDYRRADKQAAIAEKNVPLRLGSVMGGKSIVMRTYEVLTVTDAFAALKAMGVTPEIEAALISAAKKYRDAFEELPAGITSTSDRRI